MACPISEKILATFTAASSGCKTINMMVVIRIILNENWVLIIYKIRY